MKDSSLQKNGQKSRKKPIKQERTQLKTQMCSSNLQLDFLTNEPNVNLLKQLRNNQITTIMNNLLIFSRTNKITQNLGESMQSQKTQAIQRTSEQKYKRKQKQKLNKNFNKQSLKERNVKYSSIMLLVGPPSTGKTASLKYLIQQYLSQVKKEIYDIDKINVLQFNAKSKIRCEQVINLLQKLTRNEQTQHHILVKEYTIKRINKKNSNIRFANILYIQQIQQLVQHSSPHMLDTLTEHFSYKPHSQWQNMLLGTSNNINLQQQLLKKSLNCSKNSIKIQSVIYPAYGIDALVRIMQDRVAEAQRKWGVHIQIQEKLMRYVVNKLMEAKRDQSRNVIQIVKELLIHSRAHPECVYTFHTLTAIPKLKQMLSTSKSNIIQNLNYKQQLVLIIIYNYLKNSEALQIPYLTIVQEMKRVCNLMGMDSYQDISGPIGELETYGCLGLRVGGKANSLQKKNKGNQKSKSKMTIVLKVSSKDIEHVLSQNPAFKKYFS